MSDICRSLYWWQLSNIEHLEESLRRASNIHIKGKLALFYELISSNFFFSFFFFGSSLLPSTDLSAITVFCVVNLKSKKKNVQSQGLGSFCLFVFFFFFCFSFCVCFCFVFLPERWWIKLIENQGLIKQVFLDWKRVEDNKNVDQVVGLFLVCRRCIPPPASNSSGNFWNENFWVIFSPPPPFPSFFFYLSNLLSP